MLIPEWKLQPALDGLVPPHARTLHVWKIIPGDSRVAELSDAERAEARRIENAGVRETFIASRSAIRRLVAGYLRIGLPTVQWTKDANGKPTLPTGSGLHFSLAHTRQLILIVFASEPVGIDGEPADRHASVDGIAARYFAPAEAAFLATLPPSLRLDVFLRMWVAKEAALKLQGVGLAGGLHNALTPCSTRPITAVQLNGRAVSTIPFHAKEKIHAAIAVWTPHPAVEWNILPSE